MSPTAAQTQAARPADPVLVSDEELLVDDVLRLAAAAGVAVEVAREPATALRRWSVAPVVLVGADLAGDLAATSPPRRGRVHVVGHGTLPDELFRQALGVGAESVAALPSSETWLVELLTDIGDGAATPGATIGVVGGSGGAGATVFACALAQAATARGPALLVDADPLGPGVDRVLGLDGATGVRWDAMLQATGRLSARSLRESLPRRGALSVLTWPEDGAASLQPFALREVLSAGQRGFDVVVVDLPRRPDRVVDEVVSRCDHVVLVSGLTVPAVAAASRIARTLLGDAPSCHLVTRGGAGEVAPAEVAELLAMPLLLAMGDQRGLDESVGLGAGPVRSPRGRLGRAARAAVDRLVGAPHAAVPRGARHGALEAVS
ncbi:MAG TPA: septum site-determining protein Ssd [Marmoricola sp.]|nr:septum site-determining protein Ssd [Marmoricola sp.]